jgi:hypothetical protein
MNCFWQRQNDRRARLIAHVAIWRFRRDGLHWHQGRLAVTDYPELFDLSGKLPDGPPTALTQLAK